MPFSWAPVTVLRRQPEAAERVALGVKLDEDRRLGPRDPRVVSGLDRDDLRRHDLECTAVPVPPRHRTRASNSGLKPGRTSWTPLSNHSRYARIRAPSTSKTLTPLPVGARAPRWPAWRRARARPRTDRCGKRPATPSRHAEAISPA